MLYNNYKFGSYLGWRNSVDKFKNIPPLISKNKLAYKESANKKLLRIIDGVKEELPLTLVTPLSRPSVIPDKSAVKIYSYINTADLILKALKYITGLVAIDIETRGTQAADLNNEIVGIGIASYKQILYFDLLTNTKEANQALYDYLARPDIELVGHNILFDSAFLLKHTGYWYNWKYCTYGMYRQLANEGHPGQSWGLKQAQVDLLKWPNKGDVELDNWLIRNKYVTGQYKHNLLGRDLLRAYIKGEAKFRPNKGEMWRAPAQILGYYCGLDCASTYQLLTEVLLPCVKGQYWEKEFIDYHYLFIKNIKLLAEQQLSGIKIDIDKLYTHQDWLLNQVHITKDNFINHPKINPYIKEYNKLIIDEYLTAEPNKYKNLPKLGQMPGKYTKAGKPSKNYSKWLEKWEKIITLGKGEISKNWINWKDKLDSLKKQDSFNINSGQQLQWLFYDKLKMPVIIRTDKGEPSTGVKALPGFGELGKLLKKNKDTVKELGYVNGCFDNLLFNRIHPQFRAPGTLTCRLAGSGGLNLQQLPKSRGYLECWVPEKDNKFVDCDHCLTSDHQVLTKERGWVDILNIKVTDKVWQVNKNTLVGSWVNPSRIINKEYNGDIYTFGNSRGKISVTNKHRMLFVGQQTRPSGQVKRWESLAEEGIHTAGMRLPITSNSNYKTKSDITEEEIWLACLLQADSSYCSKSKSYVIEVSKIRKIEKIQQLLNKSGIPQKLRPGRQQSYKWCGIKNNTKLLEGKQFNLLDKLDSSHIETFLEALAFWDGYKTKWGAISWHTTNKVNADIVQAYFVRHGYEAKLSIRKYKDKPWSDLYTLRIKKNREIALRKIDLNIESYKGKVGCVTVPEGYFMVRRNGQTFITGNCSLEQVVMAELSRDASLFKIYGPGAKPNDVYLFNGSQLPIIGDKILSAGYTPDNPNKDMLAKVKKECKKERTIAKIITLGSSYGMGWAKLQLTLKLEGINISEDEAREMIKAYWEIYSGVKDWEKSLIKQHQINNGWVLNGFGRPVCCAQDYIKDLVNRVVQSTGHDIHMLYADIVSDLLKRNNIDYKGIVWDFHDQSILECAEKDAEQVKYLMETAAYDILNDELKGVIPLTGEAQIIDNLAKAKLD